MIRTATTTAGRLGLAALLGAICLSGCGSGAGSRALAAARSELQSATSTTATSAPTPAPIRIGSICSCSGPGAGAESTSGGGSGSLSAAARALRAWAQETNASGGIDGHPLQLITLDDRADAALSLQEARELVSVEHAVAIVGPASLEEEAWLPYLSAAKVPVIGGLSDAPGPSDSPLLFPSGTPLLSQVIGAVSLGRTAGVRHLALLTCHTASCTQLTRMAEGAAALFNTKVESVIEPSSSPARRRAACRSLLRADVDGLFLASSSQATLALVQACERMHFTPQLLGVASLASRRVLSDPALAGMLLAAPNADPMQQDTAPQTVVQAALHRFAPGTGLSYPVLAAWSGGLLFEAAARAAGAGASATPSQIERGLYSLRSETLGGLSPPLHFTPNAAAIVPCWFSAQLTDGELAALGGDLPSCVTEIQAAALAKALG
jgi:branched-chain amino acid transport system substrate-binding protein